MKTEVMFFFDTEDFTSESCADSVKQLINILEEESITGHFAVVGLFAEQLTNWGREDVKEALKRHVIGTHTYGHTMHPIIAEESEGADYLLARTRVLATEIKAAELLKTHLGVERPMFAVPPGNSVSYVGMYCYHEMGIPFYCDAPIYDDVNTLLDYCSMTCIRYSTSFEYSFQREYRGENPKTYNEVLDEMQGHKRIIMYLHPNMCVKTEFWDILNYAHENISEYGNWIQAKDRPMRDIIDYWHHIRMMIRAIKADERFEIITLHDLLKKRDALLPKPIKRDDIPRLLTVLEKQFAPVREESYCVSDLFYAAAAFLRGEKEYIPGTVKGFLYPPQGVGESTNLTKANLVDAAKTIVTGEFVPETIRVGECCIGPADFLFAAMKVLAYDIDNVAADPRTQSVDMSEFPNLQEFDLGNGSWMHSYDFKDEYVSSRLKLQSWTLRYYDCL